MNAPDIRFCVESPAVPAAVALSREGTFSSAVRAFLRLQRKARLRLTRKAAR